MSLIRQIWLLLTGTLLLAFFGGLAVEVVSSRAYLETQLRLKNSDNAQALALALSQQKGDVALMGIAASAQFDTGFYKRISLKDGSGRLVVNHEARSSHVLGLVSTAPAWFVDLVPIESTPGIAQVSDGWRALGSVEVVSQATFAQDQLWQGSVRTALWLLAIGGGSFLLAAVGVRRIRRPLDATVAQAQALMERRFITVSEPAVPELARLSRAMNAVVDRLRIQYDEQAFQVEQLRRQAHCDSLTGLSNRSYFVAQLATILSNDDGPGLGRLYLIRVVDLTAMNRLIGYRQTDGVLQKLAEVLTQVSVGLRGVVTGRLNGGDFAVCLTHESLSLPEPEHYVDAIRRAFAELGVSASVVVGTTSWARGVALAQVLAAADSALARAESRGNFAIESTRLDTATPPVRGEDQWRRSLTAALAEQRLRLVRFPVLDRQSSLAHYECPMRLQLAAGGPFELAASWLPMAVRCNLISQFDEAAVAMALAQISADRLPRGVNISPASLADSGFVPRLRARLAAAPQAAQSLWLEVAEGAALERFELVRDLCEQLRPLGVRIGLEHAGERLTRIERLPEAGLDYVKLDASVVQGVAQDAAFAAFVTGTAAMLHGLGLQVYAEGVTDVNDIAVLIRCGVDGVTGPAVLED